MNGNESINKEYLSKTQAAVKLSFPGTVSGNFISKDECLEMGAASGPLEKYASGDFPAADDIVPGLRRFEITVSVSGYEGSGSPSVSDMIIYYNK